jgi:hypothetical protein
MPGAFALSVQRFYPSALLLRRREADPPLRRRWRRGQLTQTLEDRREVLLVLAEL